MLEDMEEQEMEAFDDSDADPDYTTGNNSGCSSSDSGDEDDVVEEAVVNKKEKKRPEVRIYMQPPTEKADGGTDRDSG